MHCSSRLNLPGRRKQNTYTRLKMQSFHPRGARDDRSGVATSGSIVSPATSWILPLVSGLGALGLAIFLAVQKFEVDMAVYLMGGRHAFSALLYRVEVPRRPYLVFTYPPFAAILFAPLADVVSRTTAQVLWAIVNIAALFGLIHLSLRLARPHLDRLERRRWSMVLLLPTLLLNPVLLTVGLGQVDLVLCLAVLFDLCSPRQIGRVTVPLGLIIGVAASIKLTPLLFIPYLLMTGRRRGALTAGVSFILCTTIAFVLTPRASWIYWRFDVRVAKRAGALFDVSDQNLRSLLSRFLHEPVPGNILWPLVLVIAVGGLLLAARAHRSYSPLFGVIVCANTELLVSPITWTHHLVWIVPALLWLGLSADAPRHGALIALALALVFWSAPIWRVPTSYIPRADPIELHEHGWQLIAGNAFALILVLTLVATAILLGRRASRLSRRSIAPSR